MRKTVWSILIVLCMSLSAYATVDPLTGDAKYVFYMIGDGMASVQIHAAEAYLGSMDANDMDDESHAQKVEDLAMTTELPYTGMQKSWALNQFITDSAAAGTALACGQKTNVGVISMDSTTTTSYKTLAELAKEQGKKVGILSSVSLDHATPGRVLRPPTQP